MSEFDTTQSLIKVKGLTYDNITMMIHVLEQSDDLLRKSLCLEFNNVDLRFSVTGRIVQVSIVDDVGLLEKEVVLRFENATDVVSVYKKRYSLDDDMVSDVDFIVKSLLCVYGSLDVKGVFKKVDDARALCVKNSLSRLQGAYSSEEEKKALVKMTEDEFSAMLPSFARDII